MTQGSSKTNLVNRSGVSARSQAKAAPKQATLDGVNLGLANGRVSKPKPGFRPFRAPDREAHGLVVCSYVPGPRYRTVLREGTRKHWALFLLTEPGRNGQPGRGLLHDIVGQPLAFYQRRLRDVRLFELGDGLMMAPVANVYDVAAYDETVSTTRIANSDPSYNSQHWVHESVERLHDRKIIELSDTEWNLLESGLIRFLEGTP